MTRLVAILVTLFLVAIPAKADVALWPRVPGWTHRKCLEAAEKSYLETAHNLGYQDADAQQWASAVMSRLRIEEDSYKLRMLTSPPTSPS